MFDLSLYESHPTLHLIESPKFFSYDDFPIDWRDEFMNWACCDMEEDWDFRENYGACTFVIGTVKVARIVEEVERVIREFCALTDRSDWRWAWDDASKSFKDWHQDYMRRCVPFEGQDCYQRCETGDLPISLTSCHDDPEFPVIRDGWHRFNFAYARGQEVILVMTELHPQSSGGGQ